ncbi:MAG: hypothetical protein RIS90_2374 [Pseudomonadota bacterium]|jgi:FtsH-binding integral membrane protein
MQTSAASSHQDLAFLRALAEAGKNAPLTSGPYLVTGGGWFALASLLIGLADMGWIPFKPAQLWPAMLGAMVGFAITMFVLHRRDAGRIANDTNRLMGEAWSAAGLGIFLFFVAVYIAAARTGQYAMLNAIALFVLAVYAMAWRITARITGRRWMDGVSALTVVSLFAVALALGTSASWLAYAGALVLCGVLPGLYMMRLARAAQG